MKRCIIFIFILIFFNLPCHAGSKWFTWKYDNFIIYSNVSKEKSAIVTRQIIAAYDLIKTVFFKTGEKPTIPFTIYILSNVNEVKSIYHGKIKGDIAAFMAKSDEGIKIILPYENRELAMQIVTHEIAHYYIDFYLITKPWWYNEGLASFAQYSSLKADSWVLGSVCNYYVRLLMEQKKQINLDKFLRSGRTEYLESQKEKNIAFFYAQSWLLMHYLINGENGSNLKIYAKLTDHYMNGDDSYDSFKNSIGMNIDEFEKNFLEYLKKFQTDVPQRIVPISSNSMLKEEDFIECNEPEMLYHDIMLDLQKSKPEAAGSKFHELKKKYPADYWTWLSEAEILEFGKHYSEGVEAINKALNVRSNDAYPHYLKTRLLLSLVRDQLKKDSYEFEPGDLTKDNEAIIKQAIIHLRKAVEINPSMPFQHYLLSRLLFLFPDQAKDALEHSQKAVKLDRSSAYYRTLAIAYMHNTMCSQAQENARLALKLAQNDNREFSLDEKILKQYEDTLADIKKKCEPALKQ